MAAHNEKYGPPKSFGVIWTLSRIDQKTESSSLSPKHKNSYSKGHSIDPCELAPKVSWYPFCWLPVLGPPAARETENSRPSISLRATWHNRTTVCLEVHGQGGWALIPSEYTLSYSHSQYENENLLWFLWMICCYCKAKKKKASAPRNMSTTWSKQFWMLGLLIRKEWIGSTGLKPVTRQHTPLLSLCGQLSVCLRLECKCLTQFRKGAVEAVRKPAPFFFFWLLICVPVSYYSVILTVHLLWCLPAFGSHDDHPNHPNQNNLLFDNIYCGHINNNLKTL